MKRGPHTARLVTLMLPLLAGNARAVEPCRIRIVEEGSGWPVPLVELRTTHNVRFVSDNAGVIAFDLPELMGVKTWFAVEGHGYGVPADGFGHRGVRLTPTPGSTLTVQVTRQLPGKRLGRITGAGIFGESQRFGRETAWRESGVMGCDSVQLAEHNGRLHPELTPPDSPVLLYEATYTRQFAKHPETTPRHDYNQVLYRRDLDDPALAVD